MKKTFDTVDHNILLKILHHYGIRGHINKRFESYLTERKQYVQIDSSYSECRKRETGVPQGSVLEPLLFLLYINDIANNIVNGKWVQLILFADDTNVTVFGNFVKVLIKESEEILHLIHMNGYVVTNLPWI